MSGRSKLHLEIGPRLFQVTTSAIALPGEEHRVFAVSLVPVARAEANDPYGIGSTRRTQVLRTHPMRSRHVRYRGCNGRAGALCSRRCDLDLRRIAFAVSGNGSTLTGTPTVVGGHSVGCITSTLTPS